MKSSRENRFLKMGVRVRVWSPVFWFFLLPVGVINITVIGKQ